MMPPVEIMFFSCGCKLVNHSESIDFYSCSDDCEISAAVLTTADERQATVVFADEPPITDQEIQQWFPT